MPGRRRSTPTCSESTIRLPLPRRSGVSSKREGFVGPEPHKRPRSSLIRFEAELPNEMWQADVTGLAAGLRRGGRDPQHSWMTTRGCCLGSDAYARRSKPPTSLQASTRPRSCTACPASFLSDNGAVFTGSYRGGKVLLGVRARAPRSRVQELKALPPADAGARSSACTRRSSATWPHKNGGRRSAELQGQLDAFLHSYNHIRPHRAVGRRTPLQAYSAKLKARPQGTNARTYFRVREDKVDKCGKVSLRYDSRLYKIGLGQRLQGTPRQAPDRRPRASA